MKFYISTLALAACIGSLVVPNPVTASSTIMCPDLAQVNQVMECPAESEVKRQFKKSCGFEHDPDAVRPELCDSYKEFKRRKYTALWESVDGEFMGYVSCDLPPEKAKMAKSTGVAVSQKKGMYKVACKYEDDIKLNFRTRSVCRVEGHKSALTVIKSKCGPDGASCKVACD